MICEKCKLNPATVHVQQFINGVKTESFLCQNCAGESEQTLSFDNIFQNLMQMFVKPATATGGGLAAIPDITAQCHACGLSYNDFKKISKFGCSTCYQVFKKPLDQIFRTIQQGRNIHEGKFPQKSGVEMIQKKTIENLRILLIKAVQDEEFEKAAFLRDKIKEMESNVSAAPGLHEEGADGKMV